MRALLSDGRVIWIRGLTTSDVAAVVCLREQLPKRDRYLRFVTLGPARLAAFAARLTRADDAHRRTLASVAGHLMRWTLVYAAERASRRLAMSMVRVSTFDHAVQVANSWVRDVAKEFDTEDQHFAYRVLRAWLHTLRDRLTVQTAAHFAAQLPELLRGVYYEGWNPSAVPEKYDAQTYMARFARAANISVPDVPRAIAATTTAVRLHLPATQVDKAFDLLPKDIYRLLQPQSQPQPR